MALAITSTTGLSNGPFTSEHTAVRSESENAAESGGAQAADDAAPSTRESVSERPVRETQSAGELTLEEQRQVAELQQRDREVKAHELAHKSVGGRYVTGGSFTYQTGPDGRRYAIGGEVSIDSSTGSTPRETLQKAELIRRAALAPADPSPQDYRVASQASLMAAEARAEISAERRQELMQARETRQQDAETPNENSPVLPRQGQRAISSFEAIGGISALQSNPDPIDELV